MLTQSTKVHRKKGKSNIFEIEDARNQKVWQLEANSEKEMFDWITVIEKAISSEKISAPVAVEHKVHVDFNDNEDTGFNGLPKHWEVLLKQSGISAKDFGENGAEDVLHLLEFVDAQITGKKLPVGKPLLERKERASSEYAPNNASTNDSQEETISKKEEIVKERKVTVIGERNTPLLERSSDRRKTVTFKIPEKPVSLISELTSFEQLPFGGLDRIGHGASGTIFVGVDERPDSPFHGCKVAVKKMPASMETTGEDTENTPEMIESEIDIMSTLKHHGVVSFVAAYKVENYYCLAMEYMDAGCLTDILDLYRKMDPMSESHIAYVVKCTFEALAYLHSLERIHRDIKSDNLLLSLKGDIKIADFGYTVQLTPTKQRRNTVIGTPVSFSKNFFKTHFNLFMDGMTSTGCLQN